MFGITSYLHKFGITEDGEDFVGEILFITAECEDGTRYSHDANFPTAKEELTDHGSHFIDLREYARSRAEKLLARINNALGSSFPKHGGDALNPEFWTEIAPAYGSKAYVDMDMEGVYAELEMREDHGG